MVIVVKKYAKADIRIYEFTTTHAHFSLLLSFFTQPECKHIFKQGTIALYSQGLHRKFLKKSQEKGLKYVNINVADFSTVIVLNLNFKAYWQIWSWYRVLKLFGIFNETTTGQLIQALL